MLLYARQNEKDYKIKRDIMPQFAPWEGVGVLGAIWSFKSVCVCMLV